MRRAILLAPACALLTAGVVAPLLWLVRLSLYTKPAGGGERQYDVLFYLPDTWTLSNFSRVAADPFYVRMVLFTIGLGLLATVIAVMLGYILAIGVHQAPRRWKGPLIILIALPKFTSLLLFIFGLKMIFGANGFWPVVTGETLILLPYAALTIAAALEAVPRNLVEAARGLGASATAAFWSVTFRLSLPGLIAATVLTMLWSLGAFLSPFLLGEPAQYTIGVQVNREVTQDLDWPVAATLNLILLALVAMAGYAATRARVRYR
jgi:ABC-type spermidine/putrescine transport system permease subunit I